MAVQVTRASSVTPSACTNQFISHTLDYVTAVNGAAVHLFESNGSGVAINDLNGDGLLDLVFANLDGPDTILWNEGNFHFRSETLDDTSSRAVNIVDVDGDGLLDIVFTHRAAGVSYWHNVGITTEPKFVRQSLPGVMASAYAMAWGDLNGDNALDLVTGSYNAELNLKASNGFDLSSNTGVFYDEQHDGTFVPQRLDPEANTLTIALTDLTGDGQADILVGNDFTTRDAMWLRTDGAWQPASIFATTPHSTMSVDVADIDNSGSPDIFASDMNPYNIDVPTMASWLPVMNTMPKVQAADDPQTMRNVLQVRSADGRWRDEALNRSIDATGWSWSSQLGDLNNDGWLDLYVVNGMIAAELFPYLPNNELIEQNQALRNLGNGTFAPAPEWGLGSTASGRGMSMADLNNDGRLDIVVNNLKSPAQVFENQLCGGASLEVDLSWPESKNTRALGAQLALHTSTGTYYREVQSGSGYLSGDASRIHFGVPADAIMQELDIVWPDGAQSSITDLAPNTNLKVTR
jgi:enediyne biosynthesis protein E4